jgi:hypothetical protein
VRATPEDGQRITALCEQWRALQRRAEALGAQMDAVGEAAGAIPPPPALLRRLGDGLVLGTPQAIVMHPEVGEPYRQVHVDQLRHLAGEWSDPRSREIVAAFEAWRATVDTAMAPIVEIEEEREGVLDQRDAVHAEIMAAPVTSWAGVAVKASLVKEITTRPGYTTEEDADGVPLAMQVVRDVEALATLVT